MLRRHGLSVIRLNPGPVNHEQDYTSTAADVTICQLVLLVGTRHHHNFITSRHSFVTMKRRQQHRCSKILLLLLFLVDVLTFTTITISAESKSETEGLFELLRDNQTIYTVVGPPQPRVSVFTNRDEWLAALASVAGGESDDILLTEDFDNVGVYTNFDGGRRVPLQHFEVMGRGSTGFRTSNFINVTSGKIQIRVCGNDPTTALCPKSSTGIGTGMELHFYERIVAWGGTFGGPNNSDVTISYIDGSQVTPISQGPSNDNSFWGFIMGDAEWGFEDMWFTAPFPGRPQSKPMLADSTLDDIVMLPMVARTPVLEKTMVLVPFCTLSQQSTTIYAEQHATLRPAFEAAMEELGPVLLNDWPTGVSYETGSSMLQYYHLNVTCPTEYGITSSATCDLHLGNFYIHHPPIPPNERYTKPSITSFFYSFTGPRHFQYGGMYPELAVEGLLRGDLFQSKLDDATTDATPPFRIIACHPDIFPAPPPTPQDSTTVVPTTKPSNIPTTPSPTATPSILAKTDDNVPYDQTTQAPNESPGSSTPPSAAVPSSSIHACCNWKILFWTLSALLAAHVLW